MNISERAKENIESCRFCWMCRHICPIAIASGQERNTARARALAISVAMRGAEPWEGIADNLYECALCGACVKECVTGWDPVLFTREARGEICREGILLPYVEKMLENFENHGNVYGKIDPLDLPYEEKKTDTLLFLGEDARYCSADSANGAVEILRRAGVKFTVLRNEPNSGNSLYFLAGKSEELRRCMTDTARVLNEYKTVIIYDPADLKLFVREYKEFGIGITAQIAGFHTYLLELLQKKALRVKKSTRTYTVQDNFNYARELGDEETVRKIVDMLGASKEFLMHGKDTMFAGSLLMREYMPEVMRGVAEARWKNAAGVGADTVVTESPCEYEMLKMTCPAGCRVLTAEGAVSENLAK